MAEKETENEAEKEAEKEHWKWRSEEMAVKEMAVKDNVVWGKILEAVFEKNVGKLFYE